MSIFIDCVISHLDSLENEKKDQNFFNNWFRNNGKAYTFVFKKNLKITNIQYSELLSLIRSNIKINNNSNSCKIQFLSTKEFREKINNLIESYFSNYKEESNNIPKEDFNLFDLYYAKIFENIIVIDAFYGSCLVLIPYNMKLDIKLMCGLSGYIHSCGENIFTRHSYRINKKFILNSLMNFIRKNTNKDKLPFILYSREDFSVLDNEQQKKEIINGLEDHKFYIEKFYIQAEPLVSVLDELENNEELSNKIYFVKSINGHPKIKGKYQNSLWLIIDRSVLISQNTVIRGDDIYFICYNQQIKNENQFNVFDENKPGWIDHTTIPHTLIGAMLNICLDDCNISDRNKKIDILDPFVGAGTTYFESLKFKNINFLGSDLSKLSTMAIYDNMNFFSLDKDKMESLLKSFLYLKNYLGNKLLKNTGQIPYKNEIVETYKRVKKLIKDDKIINDGFVSLVEHNDIKIEKTYCKTEERLMYYIFLKAIKRNVNSFKRNSKSLQSAFLKEISEFTLQFNKYYNLKKRSNTKIIGLKENNNLTLYLSEYSLAYSISYEKLKEELNLVKNKITNNSDAIIMLEDYIKNDKKFDIIITDPPYGFNTNEDLHDFSYLYYKIFDLMIKCLKNKGQIILCLPDASFIGRQINYFTLKEIIINQILLCAAENKKEVVKPYNVLPSPSWLYKPPYYWESEKALRRSVLHFIFKDEN